MTTTAGRPRHHRRRHRLGPRQRGRLCGRERTGDRSLPEQSADNAVSHRAADHSRWPGERPRHADRDGGCRRLRSHCDDRRHRPQSAISRRKPHSPPRRANCRDSARSCARFRWSRCRPPYCRVSSPRIAARASSSICRESLRQSSFASTRSCRPCLIASISSARLMSRRTRRMCGLFGRRQSDSARARFSSHAHACIGILRHMYPGAAGPRSKSSHAARGQG